VVDNDVLAGEEFFDGGIVRVDEWMGYKPNHPGDGTVLEKKDVISRFVSPYLDVTSHDVGVHGTGLRSRQVSLLRWYKNCKDAYVLHGVPGDNTME
jgi:hypothetical protein